jgi:hypothetical protein
VFYCCDGIQDRVGTVLVINCECRIAMLHLVSGSVIPQQRLAEPFGLGRKSDGGMREQRGELNISEVGVRESARTLQHISTSSSVRRNAARVLCRTSEK